MKPSRCLDVGGGGRGREGVAATQHGERRAGAGAPAEREERGDGDPRDLSRAREYWVAYMLQGRGEVPPHLGFRQNRLPTLP